MSATRQSYLLLSSILLGFLAPQGVMAQGAAEKRLTSVVLVLTTPEIATYTAHYTSVPTYLGYWEKEGLRVTIQPSAGSAAGTQAVAAGRAEFVNSGTSTVLAAFPKAPNLRIVYFFIPGNLYEVSVQEESAIKVMADLKGKNIGVQSLAAASYFYGRSAVVEAGLNPDKDVMWLPIGVGALALHAIRSGQVDAYAGYDGPNSQLEGLGLRLRQLHSPLENKIAGLGATVVREETLKGDPKMVAGFLRGMAKGVSFTTANPEAAVRIHWKL